MPNTLAEWIARDGLTHFKIKLNGGNEAQDFDRITRIDRVARTAMTARRVSDWNYLLDFNEGCPDVGYLLGLLRKVREATPDGFRRIKYVEQPTSRDLARDRANVMHEASKLLPVVVDEGLVDLETLLLAREMGYTGVALKACKGQSGAMLMAAAAQKYGMFLCVQDLDLPGRVADPLGGDRGPCSRQRRHRGQRTPVRPGGQRRVGSEVPGAVHRPRWRPAHRAAHRAWPRCRSARAPVRLRSVCAAVAEK